MYHVVPDMYWVLNKLLMIRFQDTKECRQDPRAVVGRKGPEQGLLVCALSPWETGIWKDYSWKFFNPKLKLFSLPRRVPIYRKLLKSKQTNQSTIKDQSDGSVEVGFHFAWRVAEGVPSLALEAQCWFYSQTSSCSILSKSCPPFEP